MAKTTKNPKVTPPRYSVVVAQDGKLVERDRETGEYRCSLDGEVIGWAKTAADGESAVNAVVYARLTK